jgi:predicted nucleic acid-binding Zn finger protein
MKKDTGKINSVISEKRIKLHIFEPSQRKIWTVVGKEKEYWIDPEQNFCSCQSFYFNSVSGRSECYHLKSINLAQHDNQIELIKFSDEEFPDFISALVDDL